MADEGSTGSWWSRLPHRPRVVVAVCLACAVPLAIVGLLAWSVHSTWGELDDAADAFGVPPGFTELQRVRSGTALCFVTCTNGGEAVVTVVFDPGSLPLDEACDTMERAVEDFLESAGSAPEPSLGFYECNVNGPLEGTMRIGGSVEHAKDLCAGCGERWLDESAVPDLPVVAWVEFNSGIE